MTAERRLHAQAFWGAYFASMEQVAFDAATPVYVASGLLTYMDERGASVCRPCTWV